MQNNLPTSELYNKVIKLLNEARNTVIRSVNQTMVLTYYQIGKIITIEEQKGRARAEYGKQLLIELSKKLKNEFGKGFSVDNLENMRKLYLTYSKPETLSRKSKKEKSETLSRIFKLSWSHYLKLMRIKDENERNFYEIEAFKNN